jgi:hypothetical protein
MFCSTFSLTTLGVFVVWFRHLVSVDIQSTGFLGHSSVICLEKYYPTLMEELAEVVEVLLEVLAEFLAVSLRKFS